MAEARIDKWLWASRIFKTRTIAAEACKKGRVYQRHSGEAIENDKTGRSDTGKETTCHVLI